MNRPHQQPRFLSLIMTCGCIALSACAATPEAKPPTAMDSLQYAASLPPGTQPWPSEDWWHDFGDPQLDQLIDEALAHSPTMIEAAARIQVAAAQASGARAALLPSVSAVETIQDARISQNVGLPSTGKWDWLGATLLQGNYEIDFWGKNRAAVKAAISEETAAKADAAAARLTLASQIASVYADFARLHVNRDLAASAKQIRTQIRDLVAMRVDAGTAPLQNLEQAASALETADARLESVDESIELARHMVAALVGAGPDRGDRLTSPALINRRNPGLPNDLPLALVGRKPELIAAVWRAEAASQRIHQAKAAYYPNVNLMAAFGVVSFGLNRLFEQGSELGAAGPAINLPIFEGGRLTANYHGAQAEYDLAVASYQDVLLQSLNAAADAVASLKALPAESHAADAAESRAQRAYDLAKLRYEGGLADYDSVLISEDTLVSARDEAATFHLRGYQLDIALAKALGGGFSAATLSQRIQQ